MDKSDKIKIIAVVGPTAVGKTRLGVFLAKKLCGEIISADSMQIYKGMDIATAKPSREETEGIRHHLIDFLSPDERFSVGEFIRLADSAASDILSKNKLPIIVGGTGLYIDSFLSGLSFIEFSFDDNVRQRLTKRLKQEGAPSLLDELKKIDPKAAAALHPNNTGRIIRALELYETTGKTISEQNELSRMSPSKWEPLYIGVAYRDRKLLWSRINQRVDKMLEQGLLEEARTFYSSKRSHTAAAAIGYKELKPYLDGEKPLDDCIDSLKTATRQYAKRQGTWFKKNKDIIWFYKDDYDDFSQLENKAYETVRGWLNEKK